MKKTKRFIATLLCAIGCFALVACGGAQEDSSSSSKGNSNGSSTSDPIGDDKNEDIFD